MVTSTNAANVNITQTGINSANTSFTSGGIIRGSHITLLSQLIRDVSNHTHSLTQYSSIHTYGNTGGTYSYIIDTAGVGLSPLLTGVAGTNITAGQFNTLVTECSKLRSHAHTWTDT